ncbi:hypothetical protein CRUP_006190 [Coryphaenoides rupestris]|nr:hypothetical protein CRUP_006190 [Coryphaenoides rupestris]
MRVTLMLISIHLIKLSEVHQVALSIIGYVGCAISIFCLAITLVTFAILSSVSTIRNQRYHIHANLSFAILVAEILLLISSRFEPGTLPCKVMAVLLHLFFLSAFAWMLVEGLHLYSMVVKVFGSEGSKHLYYYAIGWGSPLVICVVSMTSSMPSYGEIDKLTAKAVAVLLPILGISWIFGVLAVNTHSLPFLYIFAVFNSLQGFFVFLFHCLLNSEMNGNKEGVTPTKMNTWDKSTNSANRIDLSAV